MVMGIVNFASSSINFFAIKSVTSSVALLLLINFVVFLKIMFFMFLKILMCMLNLWLRILCGVIILFFKSSSTFTAFVCALYLVIGIIFLLRLFLRWCVVCVCVGFFFGLRYIIILCILCSFLVFVAFGFSSSSSLC